RRAAVDRHDGRVHDDRGLPWLRGEILRHVARQVPTRREPRTGPEGGEARGDRALDVTRRGEVDARRREAAGRAEEVHEADARNRRGDRAGPEEAPDETCVVPEPAHEEAPFAAELVARQERGGAETAQDASPHRRRSDERDAAWRGDDAAPERSA